MMWFQPLYLEGSITIDFSHYIFKNLLIHEKTKNFELKFMYNVSSMSQKDIGV